MINRIINFSIKNKLIVILFTLSIAAFGVYSVLHIPVGAVPDITNNQIQVITVSENLSTQDVEQFITYPVELEMGNLPGVTEIRSISKFGLSVVTIVFEEDMGTYLPRQLIAEKIKAAAANIPEGFGTPEMGPISTGLGEIYQYVLDTKPGYEKHYSAMELRSIQDWVVKRQLSGIPGVVEVNTWGGFLKQYEVSINPEVLNSMNISLLEVYDALEKNNGLAGGGYIEKENLSYFIRGDGIIKTIEDIELIVVKQVDEFPILIGDIAEVKYGYANRFGAITANGEGEKVMGQIMMLKDANSKLVIQAVKDRIAEVQKNLPEGVFINPVLERSELIDKTSFTIIENLLLGCLIVMLIVILLLGNIRSALVIASIIPLALLFTISLMYIFGIDANLMSLGALDFGIIIDGAVIIVEFIALRITLAGGDLSKLKGSSKQNALDKIAFEGSSKMINSAIFGQVIILIVLIPIFVLEGVEGKMFRPMAMSFSFAIIGAMIFGLTWVPVAAALFLKPEKENKKGIAHWIMKWAHASYKPAIELAYNYKKTVFAMAIASLIFTGYLFTIIGGEFVPTLDEGDFVIQPVLKTGTSLTKTIELTTKMENILLEKFTEVDQIVCRIGAAEVPTDPMSMEEIDMIIKLKPRSEWIVADSKEELADLFKEALMIIPGIDYEFTQPIEMRFNELITGVRADIAVKIFGEDLDYLNQKAIEIKQLIEDVPGAADVIMEKTAGLPQMIVEYDRNALAMYGLSVDELNEQLSMAFGGSSAGKVFEGERRFDLVVRLNENYRKDLESIKQLNVGLPNGEQIPLSQLAKIEYTEGPAKISRENTQRRVVVSVNVRNRDLESVVKDIQEKIDENVVLTTGNYITYGGQFENLNNATTKLLFAVPVALLLIFVFLHFAFGSFKEAAMIFTAVPLSAVGGVFLLWVRDMPFSVSAGIGFIALFGVAVLNGIVLIEHLNALYKGGMTDMRALVMKATRERLRPVILTASAAALGFLPMAISTNAGAEVQRPLATVVIGGLVTATLLTMIMLPLLYATFHNVTGIQLWPLKWKRKVMGIVGFLFLVPMLGHSQVNISSMESAVDLALENNIELHTYLLNVEKQKALQASAWNIEATQFYYDFDENNMADNGHPLNVFGIEQNFNFPTVYTSQKKVNKAYTVLSELQYENQIKKLSKEVSLVYQQLQYYYYSQRNYLLQIDSVYQLFMYGIEESYKAGELKPLDKLNAQVLRQEVSMELTHLDFDISIAEKNIAGLLQSDTVLVIEAQEIKRLNILPNDQFSISEKMVQQITRIERTHLKHEQNTLLPDIKLGYYNGTNRFEDSKHYNGYTLGLGIPIFFGEKKSKIKARKIGLQYAEERESYTKLKLKVREQKLMQEMQKYDAVLKQYDEMGANIYMELIRNAKISFQSGDISVFEFVQSVKSAIDIHLYYLENLLDRNKVVLEINYLSL